MIYRELASVKFTNCCDKMSPFMMRSTRAAYIKGTAMERVAKTKQWPGSPAAFVCFSSRIGDLWKDDPTTRLLQLWFANCQWNGIISFGFILPPQGLLSIISTRKAWGGVQKAGMRETRPLIPRVSNPVGKASMPPSDLTQMWQVGTFNTILYFSRSKFICSESPSACLVGN